MKRAVLLTVAAVAAFAGCAKALAAARASATASVVLQNAAGINVVSPLVLPTVSTTAVINTPVTSSPAGSTSAASAIGNATLTISSQSGPDAVSVAVPETFKVTRTGGTETLTVRTNTNAEYDVAGNGVVLGGALNADTMSVNVGGSLSLASESGPLVPGPYEGMLVVVVQYN